MTQALRNDSICQPASLEAIQSIEAKSTRHCTWIVMFSCLCYVSVVKYDQKSILAQISRFGNVVLKTPTARIIIICITAQKGVVLCASRPRVMPQYEPHLSAFGCRWCRRHRTSCSADDIVTDVTSAQIWAFAGWASATDIRVLMTQIILINKLITRGQHWMCASHERHKIASHDVLYLCVGFQAHAVYI